ncbi:MAG: aminopeptidase P family protein [Micrococcaceae bacterium]
MNDKNNTPLTDTQKDRVDSRSRRPSSEEFKKFIRTDWAESSQTDIETLEVAKYTKQRRAELSKKFPGDRLIIPAGDLKVRSNDTDYRFRAHSAFTHFIGTGAATEPGAVLVLEPETDGHKDILYFSPANDHGSFDAYADARRGEFWVGPRSSLNEIKTAYDIDTKDIADFPKDIKEKIPGKVRIIREADPTIELKLNEIRTESADELTELDAKLSEAAAELRLIKDQYGIDEMRKAVAATVDGFENIVRNIPVAVKTKRGERVVETSFFSVARVKGNELGYDVIAASGNNATTLHWMRNSGPVKEEDLLLVDAGVEVDSLYTADVTRCMPITGKFSETQRKIYQAVLDAADAAFEVAIPGNKFRDVHDAAMKVIAARLEQWGLLPSTAAEALNEELQYHRRWMVHGTSHHLGIDVHDCAQAREELYLDGTIEEGMIFTIEPGLYFKENDLKVPEEYRGIGVRIEDDVLITKDGNENLSKALPRKPADVEAWMQKILAN